MKSKTLFPYYRSFFHNNIRDFLLGLLAGTAESACMVGTAWLVQQLLDACTDSPGSRAFPVLLALSAGLIVLYFSAIQLDRIATSRFIPRAMAQYRNFIFARLSVKSMAAFRQENTATYLSAINNDAKQSNWVWVTCSAAASACFEWYLPLP